MNSDQNPCKVYIRRPGLLTEKQIYQHLRDNGFDEDFIEIRVPTDAAGRSSFVIFASKDIAVKALHTLHGTKTSRKHKMEVELAATDKTVPLKCRASHHRYIDLMLTDGMPVKERNKFISSLPAEIDFREGKIVFVGDQQSIQISQKRVKKRFLSNLNQQELSFPCDIEFKPDIVKMFILTRRQKTLQFIYQLNTEKPDGKTRGENDQKGGELSIIIYSQNSDHFSEICTELKVSMRV